MVTECAENGFYDFYFGKNEKSTCIYTDPDYYRDNEYISHPVNFAEAMNENLLTYLFEENDPAAYLLSGRKRSGFTLPYSINIENRGKNDLTLDVVTELDDALSYTTTQGEDPPTAVSWQALSCSNILVLTGTNKRLRFYVTLDKEIPLGTIFIGSFIKD